MPKNNNKRSESIKAQNQKTKKNKKSKKDHTMNYHTTTSVYHATQPAVKSKILTYKDFSNTGIILMDDDIMQIIRKQSGPLAPSCEYQVHYWSLVLRATFEDDSILDICIPTVFFNYKQEVSGSRIDFELSDVDAASDILLPIHNIKMNELISTNIIEQLKESIPGNPVIQLLSTNLNSMHKHPGGINQSFSGTDLTTNHLHNTGIVFPLAEGNNKPNFAGIMAHVGAENKVAHFEYRLANGKIDDSTDESISYYRGRCVSIIRAKPTQGTPEVPPSLAESIFGVSSIPAIPSKPRTYYSTDGITEKQIENATVIQAIKTIWEDNIFLPFTESILEENIATKKHPAANQVGHYYGGTLNGASLDHLYSGEGDDDDVDWYQRYLANRNQTPGTTKSKTLGVTIPTRTATTISKTVNNTSGIKTKRSNTDFDAMENIMLLDFKSEIDLATIAYKDLDFEVRWLTHLYYNVDFEDESPIMTPEYQLKQEYRRLKTLLISNMDYFTINDKSPVEVDGRQVTRSSMLKELEAAGLSDIENDSYHGLKEQYLDWLCNPAGMIQYED